MFLPAIHICHNQDQKLHIFSSIYKLSQIDYRNVGFELKYGTFNCMMLNTGRNYSGHAVPLLISNIVGRKNAFKLYIYTGQLNKFFINFGKNNILPIHQNIKSLELRKGTTTDISLSKLSDTNLGEPYDTCKKNFKPKNGFAFESFNSVSKLGFDYNFNHCNEYYACLKLADKNNFTCPGIYETKFKIITQFIRILVL